MRITTHDIGDFLANMEQQTVYGKTVYVDRTVEPLNGTKKDATSWDVVLHATAVLDYEDGGQALLECGIDCGIDRDSDGETEGTDYLNGLKDAIVDFCNSNGLTVKPGVVDM